MRTINELSTEELRIVFEVNAKLREEVAEDMAESEMFWIGEHLDYLRHTLADWSIGQCNRNQNITVNVHKTDEFILSFEKMQGEVPALSVEYDEKVDEAVRLVNELHNVNMIDDVEKAEELEEKVDSIAESLADDLRDEFTRRLDDYCLDDIHVCDYFVEFYADARMDDEYYVDSDYQLFRDVAYTVEYA